MSEEQVKIDALKDQNYGQRTEIVRLQDTVEALQKSDVENFKQHQEIKDLLTPISETYKTVSRLAKWVMALLVFLSVLGGVIVAWSNVFKRD
jgi:hypothetical protein